MSLAKLRERIDRIDTEILTLLNERLELARRTRKLKPAVRDVRREREVISRLKARASASGGLSGEFIEGLFRRIIEESRRVQAAARGRRRTGKRRHPSVHPASRHAGRKEKEAGQ